MKTTLTFKNGKIKEAAQGKIYIGEKDLFFLDDLGIGHGFGHGLIEDLLDVRGPVDINVIK